MMLRYRNPTKLLIIIISIAVFLAGPFGFAAADDQIEQNYIIKLADESKFSRLEFFGSNITPRFIASNAPEFKNVYTFASALPLLELREKMSGDFEYLENSNRMSASAISINDPGYLDNPYDINKQWGLAKAGFPEAWGKGVGSKDVVVAVIDTGIDATHEDLRNINYVTGYNALTRQLINPGVNSDDSGHGTLIAGVLGASANNGTGIVGANWEISVMPIKALDTEGKGEAAVVSESITWAADHGADIVNLSLGGVGFGHDTTLANAITYAFNKGVIIVAAAGNDVATVGGNLDKEPVFPICDDNNLNMVIGVAATDHNDLKAQFSNYGKICIDVSAPGKRILSTINHDPLTKVESPNSYAYASGTSLAVPFVSGQAALLKAMYPLATNTQIRDRIIATADPIDGLNYAQCQESSCGGMLGSGRINVAKSVTAGEFKAVVAEGDLIKIQETGMIYYIKGGQKRLTSPFVFNQRFLDSQVKTVNLQQVANLAEGSYEMPLENTLVKWQGDPTVYVINNGIKRPLTYQVFVQYNFNFADVKIVDFPELNSWLTGDFYSPKEGTLVKTEKFPTLYWVVEGVLHPINYGFYIDRGLNTFPIMPIPEKDLARYSKGNAYIR